MRVVRSAVYLDSGIQYDLFFQEADLQYRLRADRHALASILQTSLRHQTVSCKQMHVVVSSTKN